MLERPTGAAAAAAPRCWTRALAVALAAFVVSCGGSDPSQAIQSLQSTAASASLTVHERLADAVSERFADDLLEELQSTLPDARTSISQTTLAPTARARVLAEADELAKVIADARAHAGARASAAARLDALAQALDTLARAAGAKED